MCQSVISSQATVVLTLHACLEGDHQAAQVMNEHSSLLRILLPIGQGGTRDRAEAMAAAWREGNRSIALLQPSRASR